MFDLSTVSVVGGRWRQAVVRTVNASCGRVEILRSKDGRLKEEKRLGFFRRILEIIGNLIFVFVIAFCEPLSVFFSRDIISG